MATGTRRRTKAQREAAEAERQSKAAEAEQERRVTWATAYGAPLMILDGWDSEAGSWTPTSPIGRMLTFMAGGSHMSAAAKLAGIERVSHLYSRGGEFASDVDDRMAIEIDKRVFVDLRRQVDTVEAYLEVNTVDRLYKQIKNNPDMLLKFLGRRFPNRWREGMSLSFGEEIDASDAAITAAVKDPNVALHLAKVAEAVEAKRATEEI